MYEPLLLLKNNNITRYLHNEPNNNITKTINVRLIIIETWLYDNKKCFKKLENVKKLSKS